MRFEDRFLRLSFVYYSNRSIETKRDFGRTTRRYGGVAVAPYFC